MKINMSQINFKSISFTNNNSLLFSNKFKSKNVIRITLHKIQQTTYKNSILKIE